MLTIIWDFSEMWSFCNNDIELDWSQIITTITIIIENLKKKEKLLNIVRITKMWHWDTEQTDAFGKLVPTVFLWHSCHKISICKNIVSMKHKNKGCLYSRLFTLYKTVS